LRPHVVWFGEAVPLIALAANEMSTADIIIIVGTSLQVYPAAGLIEYARSDAPVFYIDPKPATNQELMRRHTLKIIAEKATTGLRKVFEELTST
jgi:NAD-dependent deacetylase